MLGVMRPGKRSKSSFAGHVVSLQVKPGELRAMHRECSRASAGTDGHNAMNANAARDRLSDTSVCRLQSKVDGGLLLKRMSRKGGHSMTLNCLAPALTR